MMDLIITLIAFVIFILAFIKGKEIFIEQKLVYDGKKKTNSWAILREHLDDFQFIPHYVLIDKERVSCNFYIGEKNFELHFSIQSSIGVNDSCKVFYSLSDYDLVKWKSLLDYNLIKEPEKYKKAKTGISKEFLIKKSNLSEFIQKTMKYLHEESDALMEFELKYSYDLIKKDIN